MIFFATAMMVASALLLILMGGVGFFQRRLSSVVFFATAGYALVAVANTEYLIGEFDEDTYFQMALIYVVGSVVLSSSVLLASGIFPKDSLSPPVWELPDFQRHAAVSTVLAVVGLVLIVIARGENLLMNWSEVRGSKGFLTALATVLFMLSSPGVVSAFYTKRPVFGIILLLLCLSLFVVIGSRAALLGAPIFGMWLVLVRARSLGTQLQLGTLALAGVFLIHTFLRTLRGFGIAGLLQAFEEGNLLATLLSVDDDVDVSGGEANMPKYLMFSITQSSIPDFGFMTSIQRLLLIPIPSIDGFFEKPDDITSTLWGNAFEQGLLDEGQGQELLRESYMAGNFGSIHPTFFGEYFLAGGWPALVLSTIILGGVFVAIDYFMHRADRLTSLALCGPILVGYLFVARGSSVAGFGFFVYLGVLFSLLRYTGNCVSRLYSVLVAVNNSTDLGPWVKK
jgi:hypothetical protein